MPIFYLYLYNFDFAFEGVPEFVYDREYYVDAFQ